MFNENAHPDWKCTICKTKFSSRNSLGNHNRRFHRSVIHTQNIPETYPKHTQNIPKTYPKTPNDSHTPFECEFCLKVFKFMSGKYRHKKICKEAKKQEIIHQEIKVLKNEIEQQRL